MKSKKLSYLSKSILMYLASVVVLCLISLIGLVWGDYYVLTSLAISSACALINLILLIKASEGLKPDAKKSSMAILATGNFFRLLMMIAAIGLSALVIFLTNSDSENKIIYLNILASGVPFFVMTGVLAIVKPDDEDLEVKVDTQITSNDNNQDSTKE